MLRPDDHADQAPEAAAVIVPATGQRISYRTMVDQSKRLANVLRSHGLRPGDRVAIFMTNVPEYFEVVWAARPGRLLPSPSRCRASGCILGGDAAVSSWPLRGSSLACGASGDGRGA